MLRNGLRVVARGAAVLAFSVGGMAQAEPRPFRLLLWQPSDIRDGREVRFRAHVFGAQERSVLLARDPGRPTLWYLPTDAVRAGDDIRIYYQRVEKGLPEATDQRVLCVGILRGDRLVLPDLKLLPAPWGGPANVVLQRSPYRPTWGGFNVFQIARPAPDTWRLLYWDQPAAGEAGALLAVSHDGIHWRKDEARALFAEHNDAFTLVRDEADGPALRWRLYQTRLEDWADKPFPDNLPGKRRVICLRTRPDGLACCGTDAEGTFCTRPFVVPDQPLVLNADARGGLHPC